MPSKPPPEHALVGAAMLALAAELFPLCRSLTGEGVRRTLSRLADEIPLETRSVPSGERVLDWTVPDEWNIRDAYVKNEAGKRVIDFQTSNLHVVSYSVPVRTRLSLEELKPHLHTLPEQPDLIPYRTTYYHRTWGFCLAHRQLEALPEGEYEVVIDSDLKPGVLNYAELFIPGQSEQEVLFSTHICHPSLANDNLSGIALLTFLARELLKRKDLRYSYRFVFVPGTLGAISWLAKNDGNLARIKHGLVVTGVGDVGKLHYKVSRRGNAPVDRVVLRNLKRSGRDFAQLPWHPYGYDERQYGSPGFDLPVGRLSRTPYGEYPEYHTSADNLTFIKAWALQESYEACLDIVESLETSLTYRNTVPKGEPQLGRRGLYAATGGHAQQKELQLALLWLLNLSDGEHSLEDIAEASGLAPTLLDEAKDLLLGQGLLEPC